MPENSPDSQPETNPAPTESSASASGNTSAPTSPSPKDAKAKRKASRKKWIKWTLRLLGGTGLIGVRPTLQRIQEGEWLLAALTGFASIGVIVLALMAKWVAGVIEEVIDRIDQRVEESTDSLAEWIVAQLETAVVRLWWQIPFQFQGAYYKSLNYAYRTYRTQGLKTPGEFSPDLAKVFVPLRIAAKGLEQISPALIQRQEAVGNLEVWDFLAESRRVEAYRRMVIIGAPGSGKTTLLRHITLAYALNTHRKRSRKIPTLVPVMLPLHKIRDRIAPVPKAAADASGADAATSVSVPTVPDLPTVIVDQVKTLPKGRSLNLSPQWFEAKLNNGRCLVMLDGLDEVADEDQRRRVSQWVDAQMRAYPDAYWILTSRPYGYRNAQLTEARTTLGVQPFSLKQMEQFLRRWYLQNEILRQVRKRDAGVEAAAEEKAEDLIGRIKNYAPLAAIALNPLLLTMIATVHDNRGALPGSRVELYDEICDVLLVRRQEAKGLEEQFPLKPEQKKLVLQVLALELMDREERAFSLARGISIVESALQAVAGYRITPDRFIRHIETVSGLLLEREVGEYQFAHHSFQEYLASAQIKEKGHVHRLIYNIDKAWWHETIRLYAAKNDTTALVDAALNKPSIATLTIAYDCLEEGKSLAPETRQRLENRGLDAADPAIAKLAAEVKLARRLTRLLRINESVQIDQGFITWAEFLIFLGDGASKEHTVKTKVDGVSLSQNVMNLSFQAALEFCVWLGTCQKLEQFSASDGFDKAGVYFYRLPTQDELNRVKSQDDSGLVSWTMDADDSIPRGLRVVKQELPQELYVLHHELRHKNWQAADQATGKIASKVVKRKRLGDLRSADLECLSCEYLRLIEQLWVHYSIGQHGLGYHVALWQLFQAVFTQKGRPFRLQEKGQIASTQMNSSLQVPVHVYPQQIISQAMLQRFIDCDIERRSLSRSFKMVTVTEQGRIVDYPSQQAEYFEQGLGQGIGLEMVAIPGGSFMMGSPKNEKNRWENESPQHRVKVPSFFMGKYLVTQAQWRQVATFPKVNRELEPNPSGFRSQDNHPVETLSWDDAVEFCDRLSYFIQINFPIYGELVYRLPSEAEWEYACRAGTTTPFHLGETITIEVVNHNQHYNSTTEVGQFGVANVFGLYDMHGNVWEWCQDVWHSNYKGAPTDGTAWMKGAEQKYRVFRGGSWISAPSNSRSAYRSRDTRAARYNALGFRVVLSSSRGLS
ncbi:MAG: SUMF1/EgtB/PvdO family nonheme iron enzyme [Cyanobacteria bacterium P01_F01_bin.150]